jgi:hypothetical protein
MSNNSRLRYTTVDVQLANKKVECIKFVKSSCRYYFNAQHLFLELSASARAFFDYLCERMNSTNNYIYIDAKERGKFKMHIEKITNGTQSPSTSSIASYINKLSELGLIILCGSPRSCFYCINPKYVFKGTENQRIAILKDLIEDRNKQNLPINMLINKAINL